MSLVEGFFFFKTSMSHYGLDDLHATESGADGAVVASSIAARLRSAYTHFHFSRVKFSSQRVLTKIF